MHHQHDYGTLRRHYWAVPLEIIMAGYAVAGLWAGDSRIALIASFTFVVSFLPLLVERGAQLRIPAYVQLLYVGFVFASMFCGEVIGLYGQIRPWDDIMHFISGLLVGLGAMLWVKSVILGYRLTLPAWLSPLIVFCVGATVAVLWEIVEFGSDQLFGTYTQRDDLFDTMTDLIYGTGGAMLIAAMLLRSLRGRFSFGINRITRQFEQLNTAKPPARR